MSVMWSMSASGLYPRCAIIDRERICLRLDSFACAAVISPRSIISFTIVWSFVTKSTFAGFPAAAGLK